LIFYNGVGSNVALNSVFPEKGRTIIPLHAPIEAMPRTGQAEGLSNGVKISLTEHIFGAHYLIKIIKKPRK